MSGRYPKALAERSQHIHCHCDVIFLDLDNLVHSFLSYMNGMTYAASSIVKSCGIFHVHPWIPVTIRSWVSDQPQEYLELSHRNRMFRDDWAEGKRIRSRETIRAVRPIVNRVSVKC